MLADAGASLPAATYADGSARAQHVCGAAAAAAYAHAAAGTDTKTAATAGLILAPAEQTGPAAAASATTRCSGDPASAAGSRHPLSSSTAASTCRDVGARPERAVPVPTISADSPKAGTIADSEEYRCAGSEGGARTSVQANTGRTGATGGAAHHRTSTLPGLLRKRSPLSSIYGRRQEAVDQQTESDEQW